MKIMLAEGWLRRGRCREHSQQLLIKVSGGPPHQYPVQIPSYLRSTTPNIDPKQTQPFWGGGGYIITMSNISSNNRTALAILYSKSTLLMKTPYIKKPSHQRVPDMRPEAGQTVG